MTEFIEWRENIFQKDKILSVTRVGDKAVRVRLDGAEPAVYTYSTVDERNAALSDWRDVLMGPRPMLVLGDPAPGR